MRRKASGHTAVMEDHAPGVVEEDDPQTALFRKLEFFPTPPWATRAGAEIVQALDPRCTTVIDPACGEGHMTGPLRESFEVLASDVHAYTPETVVRDWLDDGAWSEDEADWAFVNPPFSLAADFVIRGLRRVRRGVAVLGRLGLLETPSRYAVHYNKAAPLTIFAPFCERAPMVLGKWDPEASSATPYAWYFYMKDAPDPGRFHIIPPGTKARLWRRDDPAKYGFKAPMPLFGEG